jgi:hypothetical protein
VAEIAALCHRRRWTLALLDVGHGFGTTGPVSDPAAVPTAIDTLAALRALNALASVDGAALLVRRNFQRFLGSAEVVQAFEI